MKNYQFIPVVLFAYARPEHLQRTLNSLKANNIPRLIAFSDAPATREKAMQVKYVREILRQIDWCETHIIERKHNLGLGKSILKGMDEVFEEYNAAIVFEDDLICVPETYKFLTSALEHYWEDSRVMSVTGWTHPYVTPSNIFNEPYFDGRAESWSWGTWKRAWRGMDKSAVDIIAECVDKQFNIFQYGADLPRMAREEKKLNIWAVRFLYLHIAHQGLCLRPPITMVEHRGFDAFATNASDVGLWKSMPLKADNPLVIDQWPDPVENPECAVLWRKVMGDRPTLYLRIRSYIFDLLTKIITRE